jgi:hypothetical protein
LFLVVSLVGGGGGGGGVWGGGGGRGRGRAGRGRGPAPPPPRSVACYTSVVQFSPIPAHPPSGSRPGAGVAAAGAPTFQPPNPSRITTTFLFLSATLSIYLFPLAFTGDVCSTLPVRFRRRLLASEKLLSFWKHIRQFESFNSKTATVCAN